MHFCRALGHFNEYWSQGVGIGDDEQVDSVLFEVGYDGGSFTPKRYICPDSLPRKSIGGKVFQGNIDVLQEHQTARVDEEVGITLMPRKPPANEYQWN